MRQWVEGTCATWTWKTASPTAIVCIIVHHQQHWTLNSLCHYPYNDDAVSFAATAVAVVDLQRVDGVT